MNDLLEKINNRNTHYFYDLIKNEKNIEIDLEEFKKYENVFKDNDYYFLALAILQKNNKQAELINLEKCKNEVADYLDAYLLYHESKYQQIVNKYISTKNINIYYFLINSLFHLGKFSAVINYSIRYLDIYPNTGYLYHTLAHCYYHGNTNNEGYKTKNIELALYYSEKSIKENYYQTYAILGDIYSGYPYNNKELGKFFYTEGIKNNIYICSLKLGIIYYEEGKNETAMKHFYHVFENDKSLRNKALPYIQKIFTNSSNLIEDCLSNYFEFKTLAHNLEKENKDLKLRIEYIQ